MQCMKTKPVRFGMAQLRFLPLGPMSRKFLRAARNDAERDAWLRNRWVRKHTSFFVVHCFRPLKLSLTEVNFLGPLGFKKTPFCNLVSCKFALHWGINLEEIKETGRERQTWMNKSFIRNRVRLEKSERQNNTWLKTQVSTIHSVGHFFSIMVIVALRIMLVVSHLWFLMFFLYRIVPKQIQWVWTAVGE